MGRFESQRAIAARTISERRRARKRHGGWGAWFARRLAALAFTLSALAAGIWIAPVFKPAPATPQAESARPVPVAGKTGKFPLAIKLTAAPEQPRPRNRARAPAAIVGQRQTTAPNQGYNVLTADELAAISQAH